MKIYLSFIFILVFIFSAFGQTPSAAPAQSNASERPKSKSFGSSLKRFEGKNSQKEKHDKRAADAQTDDEVIRVKTDLVVNSILVVNEKGNAVAGLGKDDFIITEDEKMQEVKVFSFGDDNSISRSIVLIIDYSGSLHPFIKTSVNAAKVLVDKLRPQDRMAIVTDDVKLLADYTNDKKLLNRKLESLLDKANEPEARMGWFSGHSLAYSALLATLQELFSKEDISPIVILQTDGDELQVLKPMEDEVLRNSRMGQGVERKFGLEDIYEAVEKSKATIYGIIPGIKMLGKRQTILSSITVKSGGYTSFLETPENADSIYSDILKVINNRYIIGYYSTNQERNERRRKVKVEIKGHPEFKILGRTSYIVAEQ